MGATLFAMGVAAAVTVYLIIIGVELLLAALAYPAVGVVTLLLFWVVDWATKNRGP